MIGQTKKHDPKRKKKGGDHSKENEDTPKQNSGKKHRLKGGPTSFV